MIRSKSFFPLEVREINEKKDLKELKLFTKVTAKDLAVFCKQFSSVLKAGVPVVQSLNIIMTQTQNIGFCKSLKKVYDKLQTGMTLSQSMALETDTFPGILIHMIAAAESSGTLDSTLELMANHFEKEFKLYQNLKKALAYPMIVCITAIVVVYFLLTVVVPQFIILFRNSQVELPLATKILILFGNFMSESGLAVIASIFALAVVLKVLTTRGSGQRAMHKLMLQMPIIGEIKTRVVSARFNRAMGTLLASGVSLTHAMAIAGKIVGNVIVEEGLIKVSRLVQQGKGLARPLESLGLFPIMVVQMIAVGEESGNLDEMMNKVADYYEMEVETAIEKMITLLEPTVIILLGGFIAFIILAITLPMFDMVQFMG